MSNVGGGECVGMGVEESSSLEGMDVGLEVLEVRVGAHFKFFIFKNDKKLIDFV